MRSGSDYASHERNSRTKTERARHSYQLQLRTSKGVLDFVWLLERHQLIGTSRLAPAGRRIFQITVPPAGGSLRMLCSSDKWSYKICSAPCFWLRQCLMRSTTVYIRERFTLFMGKNEHKWSAGACCWTASSQRMVRLASCIRCIRGVWIVGSTMQQACHRIYASVESGRSLRAC